MTPTEAFHYYLSVKLHFSSEDYDAFKYHFKTKADILKRKDKYFFEKLSKQADPKGLVIANLSRNPHMWIGKLFTSDSKKVYMEWKKYQEGINYWFAEDLNKLEPTDFKISEGNHPKALQKYIRSDIRLDTLVHINHIANFVNIWDQKLVDDPVWGQYRLLIKKYEPFVIKLELPLDYLEIKDTFKKWINKK